MIKVEFKFSIGEEVAIKDINVKGTILSLFVGDTGIQYNVVYFDEGTRKKEYFYEFELKLYSSKDHKFGFKII
jgi:hypothetical protein